jgi:membrane fusion protein (multidrug efflux system)
LADIDPGTDTAIAAEKDSAFANPRARRIVIGVGLLVLLAAIAWFARYQLVGKYIEGTNNAYIQADAVTVASKVAGYVDEVLVADNQLVRAGQPLLRIDPRDYRAQSAQYQAQSAMADAEGEGLRAQIAEQEAAIASARADLDAASGDASFAAAEVARYEPLVATGAESKEKLSTLRNQSRQATARAARARAMLASAERRIATLQAQIAEAHARGSASRAQLDAANVNLHSTLILASTAGRVGSKTVRVGQFVQPGMRLMSVVPEQIYIAANFKETQVGLMRIGQPVRIEVDALPGIALHGRVDSLSPGTGAQFSLLPPQNATGNFTKIVQRVPVRISVLAGPETRALLVPGMSVEVKVDTRSGRDSRDRIEAEQEKLDQEGR